jgi:pimeloyl-ACP methyl ester carboxylesterase
VTLVADEWGPSGGVPVVLLHCGAQTRKAWGGTAQALAAARFHVYSVDLRGHGDSGWARDGDYSLDAVAADIRAVASLLDRPVLVGASLGGIGALLAEAESDRGLTRALVLVDVTPRIEVEGANRILRFLTAHPEGFGSVEEAARAVAEYLPHRERPDDITGLANNLRRNESGRYCWHWDPRILETNPTASDAFRRRLDDAAKRLSLPVLVIRGGLSDVVSPQGIREFLRIVPGAEHQEVPRAGHMVAGDRNDSFTDAVLDFLARVTSPPPELDLPERTALAP